ncbi:MAG: hypothetical protein LBK68_03860 [Candidatus Margulisbacteria bacterium]|jgi:hypothetical protein|nr:hypothetical protein [Candidatus Margulisiibacteriota bacterium]
MANDYTDKFEGTPYFIKKGEQLSAAGMTAALNTKEKVANKTDAISSSNSSSTAQYPSVKAVSDALNSKENVANKKDTLSSSSTEYPSCKAVSDGLADGLAGVKLPIGAILMYDGYNWADNVTIPGWYACIAGNAGHGCPNLVGSFIKGSATASHATGGNSGNEVTVGANNLPTHTHSLSGTLTTGNQSVGHTHSIEHDHAAFNSAGNGGHTHTVAMKIKGGQGVTEYFSGWGTEATWNDCQNVNGVRWTAPFTTSDPGNHVHSIDVPNFTGNSGGISANHTHPIDLTNKSTGNNTTTAAKLNIEPQSYALIYIRRCE